MGIFDKKREVSKRLNEVKESLYNDGFLVLSEIIVLEFLLDFLNKYSENIFLVIYNNYVSICKNYINLFIGKYKI